MRTQPYRNARRPTAIDRIRERHSRVNASSFLSATRASSRPPTSPRTALPDARRDLIRLSRALTRARAEAGRMEAGPTCEERNAITYNANAYTWDILERTPRNGETKGCTRMDEMIIILNKFEMRYWSRLPGISISRFHYVKTAGLRSQFQPRRPPCERLKTPHTRGGWALVRARMCERAYAGRCGSRQALTHFVRWRQIGRRSGERSLRMGGRETERRRKIVRKRRTVGTV